MGRRTFDSLPGVLPKRRNIVLQMPDENNINVGQINIGGKKGTIELDEMYDNLSQQILA